MTGQHDSMAILSGVSVMMSVTVNGAVSSLWHMPHLFIKKLCSGSCFFGIQFFKIFAYYICFTVCFQVCFPLTNT